MSKRIPQFSTTSLLLIFPAWILATFLVPPGHDADLRVTYKFDIARRDVIHARYMAIEQFEYFNKTKFGDYDIDQIVSSIGQNDPWGNPYKFVERPSGPSEHPTTFHAYSMGADGTSSSNGNDFDDLNSWNDDGTAYYLNKLNAENQRKALWHTIWLTPLVFLAMILFLKAPNPFTIYRWITNE